MINYSSALSVLAFLLAAAAGAAVFARRPGHAAGIGFTLAMCSAAVSEAGAAMLLASKGGPWAGPGLRLHIAGLAFMGPSWLVFTAALQDAGRNGALRRRLLASSLLGCVALFFTAQAGVAGFVELPGDGAQGGWTALMPGSPAIAVGPSGRYFYIYMVLTLVLCLVNMENALRGSSGDNRRETRLLVFGAGAQIAFFIYLSSQALLLKTLTDQALALASAAVIMTAPPAAYFTLRNRPRATGIYVSRRVVCGTVSVLGVGVYLMAVAAVTHGIRYFEIHFDYFLASLLLFVSSLAMFAVLQARTPRRRVEQFISKHFYRHKHEFRDKWMETIDGVGSRIEPAGIAAAAADIITRSLGARTMSVWLRDHERGAFTLSYGPPGSPYKEIPEGHAAIAMLEEADGPFPARGCGKEASSLSFEELAPGITAEAGACVCAPLAANGGLEGFVLVGPDVSGAPYGGDDMDLLRAVCSQAAVQLRNAALSESLLAARETEAFCRMSSFVLHDLKNFTNTLSMVSENAARNMHDPAFQRDAMKAIDATAARMKGLIGKLAQGEALALRRQETDIAQTILAAARRLGLPGVVLDADGAHPPPLADADPDAVESVFLNLLSNAAEAGGRNAEIKARVWASGGFVCASVSDRGRGMDAEYMKKALWKPFRTTKGDGFGLGLFQCKAVVEAHGGSIKADSSEGLGATFTVRLPAAGAELVQIREAARA